MNKEGDIPNMFYLYLHSKIWEKTKGELISRKDIKTFLFQWKIPIKMRELIIRELIILGLLTKKGKNYLDISKPKFNLEDLNKYYRKLGVF